jgi:UDP-GlcNAc:undecaprenyl-phosphate GlcNAc-1-phosphate transferase
MIAERDHATNHGIAGIRDARPFLVGAASITAAVALSALHGPGCGALVLLATAATWRLVPIVTRLARHGGATVAPGGRSIHSGHVPLLGGLALFGPLVAVMAARGGEDFLALALGCTIMAFVGLLDDLYGLTPFRKLGGTVMAALVLYAGGVRAIALEFPHVGAIPLGYLELPLMVLWILLVTHAVNLIDGMDGLAGGVCLVAAVSIGVFGFGNPVPFVLAGALLGFLRHNLPPARVFLGDSGSLMLGFLLGALVLWDRPAVNMPVALGLLALPLGDLFLSAVRRALRGKPLFIGDRGHVHHLLIEAWGSRARVLALLLAFAAVQANFVIWQPNVLGLSFVIAFWASACVYLLVVFRHRWAGILIRRRNYQRLHLTRHYAEEALRLAESEREVGPILRRVAEDLGLVSIRLRDFEVRGGAEAVTGELVVETLPCGSGQAVWAWERPVGDPVFDEERRSVLSRILRMAERTLAGPRRRRVESPANRPGDDGSDHRPRVHFIARDRDDLIRLAPVVSACRDQVRPLVISTRPRDALDLDGIAPPDLELDVNERREAAEMARVLERYDALLDVAPPIHTVLVDSSGAATACALAARSRGIPVLRLVDDTAATTRSGGGLHAFMTGVLADRIVRLDEISAAVVGSCAEES